MVKLIGKGIGKGMNNIRLKEWYAGRIIYYQNEASADFWDEHWNKLISKEYFRSYEKGNLDDYSLIFKRYLKKGDHILEAGCGTGKYVLALKSRGFSHIVGIEWGKRTVQLVKNMYPDLPIQVGDVTNLDTPDNYFDDYISLGVVEHRKDGPEPYFIEAYRILKSGGCAIFSVPYINPLRVLKERLGLYRINNRNNLLFYQYAFSLVEFTILLAKAGFHVVDAGGIMGNLGLYDEFPLLKKIPGLWRLMKYFNNSLTNKYFGHMAYFVCIKP